MRDKFDRQLQGDRALKNSAKALVKANIEQVKQDYSAKGIGGRLAGRMSAGVQDLSEQASDKVSGKGAILAAIAGSAAVWFARKPILELFDHLAGHIDGQAGQAPIQTDGGNANQDTEEE